MRKNLMISVAVASLALGASGVALAQDNPTQDKRPAMERVEKGAPAEGQRKPDAAMQKTQAEPKRDTETRAGQVEPAKRDTETKAGQAAPAERRAEEKRAGQAEATDKRMEEKRTGQAEATEKRAEEKRAGQAEVTDKRMEEKRAGQAEATDKRMEEKRAGQIERKDQSRDAAAERARDTAAERAGAVRVEGNIRTSQERAERFSAELMRRAHPENVNITVDVGARLPEDIVFEPIPAEMVEIAPEYRGYDYVYVNDRIVFVEPGTRQVVGMIDVGGNTVAQDETPLTRAKPCPVD